MSEKKTPGAPSQQIHRPFVESQVFLSCRFLPVFVIKSHEKNTWKAMKPIVTWLRPVSNSRDKWGTFFVRVIPAEGIAPNSGTTTSQKRVAVPRRARI